MKVVFEKKEYDIKSLTIEQYSAIKDNPNISEVQLIHLLTDIPVSEVMEAPMTDVKFVAQMLLGQYSTATEASELPLVIQIDGLNYGLMRPSKLSYEEWINLEVFFSQSPMDLTKLATHFYRPTINDKIGEERELIPYSLEECQSRENLFRKKFQMNWLMAAVFFFQTFVKILTEDSQSSFLKNKKNNKIYQTLQNLKKSSNL
jgi:hypothetical protein